MCNERGETTKMGSQGRDARPAAPRRAPDDIDAQNAGINSSLISVCHKALAAAIEVAEAEPHAAAASVRRFRCERPAIERLLSL